MCYNLSAVGGEAFYGTDKIELYILLQQTKTNQSHCRRHN